MMWLDPARWMAHRPTTHATRDLEWLCAILAIAFALTLAFPGNSFANPAFAVFRRLGVTEPLAGGVMAAAGAARIVVLLINGRSPRTPSFRVFFAFATMLAWLQLAVALLIGSEEAFGIVPPVASFYAVLVGVELWNITRASFDVRYQR